MLFEPEKKLIKQARDVILFKHFILTLNLLGVRAFLEEIKIVMLQSNRQNRT